MHHGSGMGHHNGAHTSIRRLASQHPHPRSPPCNLKCATCTSTHNDNHLRNGGSTVAPLERHFVHASVKQAGAIGSPLPNADGFPCSNTTTHIAKSKHAVKHMGTERGIPKEGTHHNEGHMAPTAPYHNDHKTWRAQHGQHRQPQKATHHPPPRHVTHVPSTQSTRIDSRQRPAYLCHLG
jgi:hypothetical protein